MAQEKMIIKRKYVKDKTVQGKGKISSFIRMRNLDDNKRK
jgi:hypothetical protein